ncbi:DUF4197 domain-containing protein [Plebeiibacterium sediminum]|uniref:DUF4197 domain-containing protein n=1 Tax=Plebeiibacterium sediminum TaxID=2992112 RepID=A0AAE3SDI5_9BACT|nr:DUF4197 domain-containing protein [Plebeiobacterium sediminum]MCW3785443.1 DUF4197 domain-containing protein [Plebeiobacterium sediminum]
MNRFLKLFTFISLLGMYSCAELIQIANSIELETPLTENEIAQGLKEALRVGTDSAAHKLSVTNGYFSDEAVKILLPEEANIIVDNAKKIPGGEKLINDVILSINRAAEDAAKEAGPIFFKAITEMTITDAVKILGGEDNAATEYFKSKTYQELFALYSPKIKQSTDKKIIAGYSAGQTWESLTSKYNQLAGSFVGQMADLHKVEVELNDYLTQRALDGLFLKISNEESKIRKDPAARVTEILRRVFK